MRRLTSANGLESLHHMLRLLGLNSLSQFSEDRLWLSIASATGHALADFTPLRMPDLPPQSSELVEIAGHRVQLNQTVKNRLRACPACADTETILAEWSITHLTACRIHDVQLIDSCPGCERRITYLDRRFLWGCSECGTRLIDAPCLPATPDEHSMMKLLFGDDCSAPLPAMAKMSLDARLAVIERLGRISEFAAEDEPLRNGTMRYAKPSPDIVRAEVDLVSARRAGSSALRLLDNWPTSYHEMLASLVDRNPDPPSAPLGLNRLATRAGHLAMKPLVTATGIPIAFVAEANQHFLEMHLGLARHPTTPRVSRRTLRGVEDAPSANLRLDEYMPLATAMQLLDVGPAELANSWIKAGILVVHRDNNGGVRVPIASTEAILKRLEALAIEGDGPDFVPIQAITRKVRPPYGRDEMLIDLYAGEIRAVRQFPEDTGLRSLAFHQGDFYRRRSIAYMVDWLREDAFRPILYISDLIELIWGRQHRLGVGATEAIGSVRQRKAGKYNKAFAARDVVDHLQRSGLEQVFSMGAVSPDDNWRSYVVSLTPLTK